MDETTPLAHPLASVESAIIPTNVVVVEAKITCQFCRSTDDVLMCCRLPACGACRKKWSIDPNWKVICQSCKVAEAQIPWGKFPTCADCRKKWSLQFDPSKEIIPLPRKMTFEARAAAATFYTKDQLTLDQIVGELDRWFGLQVSRTTLRNWFEKMGIEVRRRGVRPKNEEEE
jgi:hypothetical protein